MTDVAPHHDDIARLVALYPRAFFLVGNDRKPLRIGIYQDLCAVDTGISHRKLRGVLSQYTRSLGYLATMREGVARIDLAGEPCGAVTAAEELHAIARLLELEAANAVARDAGERRRARAAPASAPPAAPKRLGLADLRVAARERRARNEAAA
jgi:ProP effector